jgi:L-alanine-DL-glutamate epimerase-like enolase superfamily enzyme
LKIKFEFELKELPLRYEWKLSRNSSISKTNGFLKATFLQFEGFGEAAPNIRYQETPERLQQEFNQLIPNLEVDFEHTTWATFVKSLRVCTALKMALDMAFQNLQAAISNKSLSEHLGIKPVASREICYTIPVMRPELIESFIQKENLNRFSWLKIKVNQELAMPMINEVLKHFFGQIAIDGNEAWTHQEAVLEFTQKLPKDRILFLEQPFPAALRDEYEWLGKHSEIPIWGDESVLDQSEPEFWKKSFKGINVKLMKAGSLENAIYLLNEARKIGLKTMVGCMVETSLGISAALSLGSLADYMDLDGFLVLQSEPFALVKEENGIVAFNTR